MNSDEKPSSAKTADDPMSSGERPLDRGVVPGSSFEREPATIRRPTPAPFVPRPASSSGAVVRGGAAGGGDAATPGAPPRPFFGEGPLAPGAPVRHEGVPLVGDDDLPIDPTEWTINSPAIAVRTGNFDGIPEQVLTLAEAEAARSAPPGAPDPSDAGAGMGDRDGAQLAVSRTLKRVSKEAGTEPERPRPEGPDPYLGTTIGERYVLDDVLGEGGMGRVYLAHHKMIGKRLAVKVLHNELVRDKEALGRFLREARAASSIGNPHIVDISDFGELPDGATYFVMEFLDGATLGELLEEKGSLPIEQVVDVALQLCDGLAAAHAQQIVHRDLKPENVTLVTKGSEQMFCKILDFGIAKVSTNVGSEKLTMAGAVFGTPHYMSPEQAAGAAVDHRTDLYSLGVMMYEMVSSQLPFNADNFMGILTQHMYKSPVPIRAIVSAPECPPGLEAVILKCLSKKPDARYATMDDLAGDLQKFKSGQIPDAVHEMMARSGSFNVPADYFKTGPAMVPATPQPPRRQGARFAWIAATVICVAIALMIWFRDSVGTAQTTAGAGSDAPTSGAEPSESSAASATTPSPLSTDRTVLFAVDPANAKARVNGLPLELPATVNVPEGQVVKVNLEADGYQPQTVLLDGTEQKLMVTMIEKESAPKPWRPRPKSPPTSTSKSPSEVVDPWASGARR